MNKEIKRIRIVLFAIVLLFISLIVYLSYFQLVKADTIKKSSYNKRLWLNEEKIKRGNILDTNDNILAYSEKNEKGTYDRIYNYDNLYSHIVGYSNRAYGKVGLELEYNNTLLNISDNLSINEIKNLVNPSEEGNHLKLTIDHDIQEYTRKALEGKKGAAVVINPKTGEIYSMVSLPDFNISKLNENWNQIIENKNSPFLNRATSGLYPPGSSFKLVTTLGLLENPNLDYNYNCTGSTTIDGYTLKDYSDKGHGEVNLSKALAKSCNTYFAEKGVELGSDKILNLSERFMINKKIPFDLPTKDSMLPEKMGKTDIAATSIGQGKLQLTPLNLALISSTIANDGKMMKPILVKNIISPRNNIIKTNHPEILSDVTNERITNDLKNMMVEVVNNGTGTNAQLKDYQVAGKTGTAENASGKSHAWFTGFAPANNPKVAIAIILEEEGQTGGSTAAPIARDIIYKVLSKVK